jgi:hypothetical protein
VSDKIFRCQNLKKKKKETAPNVGILGKKIYEHSKNEFDYCAKLWYIRKDGVYMCIVVMPKVM